jgi:hypothetical protein
VRAKLDRLQALITRRERWRGDLTQIRQMHTWVRQAEDVLSGETLRAQGLAVTNATVGHAFDDWCTKLRQQLADVSLSDMERYGLQHFLDVTANMRPHLIQCYDLTSLPRTNNDMEGFIRAIKTRCRRLTGRQSWNPYLLRYGRRVAYYEASLRLTNDPCTIEAAVRQVPATHWRKARREQCARQVEQLKQYRVRCRRQQFLQALETRWSGTIPRTP